MTTSFPAPSGRPRIMLPGRARRTAGVSPSFATAKRSSRIAGLRLYGFDELWGGFKLKTVLRYGLDGYLPPSGIKWQGE